MKKSGATVILMLLCTAVVFCQTLTQTVRGTILDEDRKLPLIGAKVIILDSAPLNGAITDENGNFRLTNVPIGRIVLQLSY